MPRIFPFFTHTSFKQDVNDIQLTRTILVCLSTFSFGLINREVFSYLRTILTFWPSRSSAASPLSCPHLLYPIIPGVTLLQITSVLYTIQYMYRLFGFLFGFRRSSGWWSWAWRPAMTPPVTHSWSGQTSLSWRATNSTTLSTSKDDYAAHDNCSSQWNDGSYSDDMVASVFLEVPSNSGCFTNGTLKVKQ